MKQSPRDTGVGGVWRRRRGDRRTRGGRSPNLGGLSILREVVVGDVSVATGALTQVERRAAGRLLNSHLESAQCVGRQRRNQARSDARVSRLGFQQGQGSRARGNESQLPPQPSSQMAAMFRGKTTRSSDLPRSSANRRPSHTAAAMLPGLRASPTARTEIRPALPHSSRRSRRACLAV